MPLQHLNIVGAPVASTPTVYSCSGSQVRKEAWKVRRLVSEFSKAARRPHWPREHAMQVLFRTAGISNWRDANGSLHDNYLTKLSGTKPKLPKKMLRTRLQEYFLNMFDKSCRALW